MDIIRSRRSVRKWKSKPVEKKQLDIIMEAAQQAPSAVNWQPYRFVLVDDPEKLNLIAKASGQPNLAKAPLLVVGVADPKRSPRWHVIDTAIALTLIMLAAYEAGLKGVWVGAFDDDSVKQSLDIPKESVVAGILALGAPDQDPPARPRKSFEELFSRNSYKRPAKS
ncbi:MAG: nitroreductase family protein [Promethearchaeati archaeon SRVP18_Atabeyarchaeia-1]